MRTRRQEDTRGPEKGKETRREETRQGDEKRGDEKR